MSVLRTLPCQAFLERLPRRSQVWIEPGLGLLDIRKMICGHIKAATWYGDCLADFALATGKGQFR
jgi:hypothetical protein